MAIGIRILSDNLSGLTTNVTFLPQSGGTISLGTQVFPFNYISEYVYGTYNCYVPTYGYTYSLDVLGPTPTPTTTVTQTNTSTPTETPTQTPTQTETPTPTPTNEDTPTQTPTNTETPTNTPTPTNTETPTNTPTPTNTETPTPTTPLTLYYNTTPTCDTINPFNNVVLDNDFCSATTITSTTVLSDGTYWIVDSLSGRRDINASSGTYTFNGPCVGCA